MTRLALFVALLSPLSADAALAWLDASGWLSKPSATITVK